MVFHHIGIACRDIEATLESVRRIHDVVDVTPVVYDELQDAHVCLVTLSGGPALELISGAQVEGLVRRQMTYYHVCYTVADLDGTIDTLTRADAILCSPPKPAILFQHRRVAFMLTPAGMIELLEN